MILHYMLRLYAEMYNYVSLQIWESAGFISSLHVYMYIGLPMLNHTHTLSKSVFELICFYD